MDVIPALNTVKVLRQISVSQRSVPNRAGSRCDGTHQDVQHPWWRSSTSQMFKRPMGYPVVAGALQTNWQLHVASDAHPHARCASGLSTAACPLSAAICASARG